MAGQPPAGAENLVEAADRGKVRSPERHIGAMADVPGNSLFRVFDPFLAVLERKVYSRPATIFVRQHPA